MGTNPVGYNAMNETLFPFTVNKAGQPSLWSNTTYDAIAPGWSFGICAKCGDVQIVNLSIEYEGGFNTADDPTGTYLILGERMCPPCHWYLTTFANRLTYWEDAQDWDTSNYEAHRQQYIDNIGLALWYSPEIESMRDDYARYVIRLIELKREEAHKERQEASPVVVPHQVPWSWLEDTDWGRFSVDTEPKAS